MENTTQTDQTAIDRNLLLAAGFPSASIQVVKEHISKIGFPLKKEQCKLREALHVSGADNTPSKRTTWCCKARTGMSLSDWKCVGLNHARCIFNAAR